MEFPRMVYRVGAMAVLESGRFDHKIVADAGELEEAKAEGWHLDQYAAGDAAKPKEAADDDAPDDSPPTRAELEAKAIELGIGFNARTTDEKLAAKIAEKLKA